MSIDHRELLKKYMRHVIWQEGVAFIPSFAVGIEEATAMGDAALGLTQEEVDELKVISSEL